MTIPDIVFDTIDERLLDLLARSERHQACRNFAGAAQCEAGAAALRGLRQHLKDQTSTAVSTLDELVRRRRPNAARD